LNPLKNKTGFTLFELIMAVSVLGLIMTSFQGVLGQTLSTHKDTQEKLEQISQARFVMDRIVRLIMETGYIETPAQGISGDSLVIEERTMDAYNNGTQAFAPDGVLDADKDLDQVVNVDGDPYDAGDPVDWTTISLDKTDPDNWKLVEVMPDYSTADSSDSMDQIILCENVDVFQVTRGSVAANQQNLLKIKLDLGKGINTISLTTRAIAGKLLIL
jgi:prepilin-type N-terminal cleavage/methylation domain-containing protein